MAINSNGSKWGEPSLGTPGGQVVWSFGSPFAELFGPAAFADGASFQPWVRAAFDLWENLADIDFVEAAQPGTGDIEINWDRIDGRGKTLGEARWNSHETGALDTTLSADITFDRDELWDVGRAADPSGTHFVAVALHEIGHALGLDHSPDPNSLMHEYLDRQRGPSFEDRAAIQEIYGPAESYRQDPDGSDASPRDVFRFFNTQTGTHFLTNSAAERDAVLATLPQYRPEGNAFDVPPDGLATLDVFRFFNTRTEAHFYTTDPAERDVISATLADYRYEGVAYRAAADDGDGALDALYRFYNTQTESHFFTASEGEVISILGNLPQYRYEGIAYYVDAA